MRIAALRNPIRDYAWGSPSAIPDLLGTENPGGGPQAELWMGAHPAAPSEAQVKAAYLFNFARYVTWPDQAFGAPDAPIRICVVGDDGFREVLADPVAGKHVGERTVTAESRGGVKGARDCHIAFGSSQ